MAWFRQRSVWDRLLLVVATAAVLSAPLLWALPAFAYMSLGFLGPLLILLPVVALMLAMRLWSSPAPPSAVRNVLALSLVTSPLLLFVWFVGLTGTDERIAPIWIVTQGVAIRLVIELPSVGAGTRVRRYVKLVGTFVIAHGLVVAFLTGSGPFDGTVLGWGKFLAYPVCTGAFAVWALWRAVSPARRTNSLTWSQVAIPVTIVLCASSTYVLFVKAFSYFDFFNNIFDFSPILGALALPAVGLALAGRDYVMDPQTRRLSAILDSQGSPSELEQVMRTGLGDPGLQLLLRVEDSNRFVDTTGRSVSVDAVHPDRSVAVRSDGQVIALVVSGRSMTGSNVRSSALLDVAGLAVEKAQLQATVLSQMNDIAESRRRLVTAADHARKEVERDLHDGAQQRLAALALTMRLIADSTSSEDLAAFASYSAAELKAAQSELQELARGIHPAVLSDSGLAAAVESLAERSPCPVSVEITSDRFAPAVELTAYFVVAEALANTAKHAAASLSEVRISRRDDMLRVVVADDGVGGADPANGSGLQGLTDRVEAVGGRLIASPRHGGGAIIVAELPLADGPAVSLRSPPTSPTPRADAVTTHRAQ